MRGGGGIEQIFDAFGRVVSETDGDGFATSYEHDDDTGALKKTIVSTGTQPLTTSVSGGNSFDALGRPTSVVDPNGRTTTYAYVDKLEYAEVTETPPTVSGAGSTTENPPLSVVRENFNSGTIDALTLAAGTTTVKSLTRQTVDDAGRVVKVERYSDLGNVTYSSSGGVSGGGGTLYTTGYHYNSAGLQFKTISPSNTAYETVFDGLGRVTGEKIGGTTVRTYLYDEYDGSAYPAEGNLTQITEKPDGNSSHDRTTYFIYDWRGRNVGMQNDVQIMLNALDNLGQTVLSQVYDLSISGLDDSTGNWTVAGSTGLRAQTRNEYDNGGRLKEQIRYSVNPGNGVIETITVNGSPVDETLKTTFGYDGRGNLVRQVEPGGLTTRSKFDGAGREIFRSVGSVSSAVESVTTEYDGNGNAIKVVTVQSSAGATRTSTVQNWYDASNRIKGSVNYGTGTSGSMPTVDGSLPSRSHTVLVTSYSYDVSGNVFKIADPNNRITEMGYDALGRLTDRYDNSTSGHTATVEANRLTVFQYNGLDQITQTSASNFKSGSPVAQNTSYTYGGSGVLGNDVLRQVTYPGGTTETYTRNNLGEVLTKAERNGVVHTYIYDGLGRMQSDSVSIPSGVADDLVDSRVFAYDVLGNLTLATAKDGGSVFNQVKREYNGLGQLVKEWQAHDGAVATSGGSPSPVVQYNYSLNSAANYSRLTSIVYPNGYIVGYQYIGVDGQISRPTLVTAAGVTVESEGYLGLGFVLNRARPVSGIADLTQELDIHGRVEDTFWKEGASTRDDLYYLYDRMGNLTVKGVTGQSTLGEARVYNTLYNLEEFQHAGTTTQWTLDSQGNRYPDARTYTVDNQISSSDFAYDSAGNSSQVRTSAGEKFKTGYDAWGQLVEATVNNASTNALLRGSVYEYDALGRRILSSGYSGAPLGDPLSVPFEDRGFYYDVAGHVIQEDKLSGVGGAKLATQARYVWSPDGRIILRDWNTDSSDTNGLEQRIYVQSDAQGNVTSLIDGSNGNVLERYTYGPFGTVEVRNADWSSYTASAAWKPTERYNWVYLYQGMRLDPLAVVYHGDSGSDYDPIEGRSMQPDLSAFGRGVNAYDPGEVIDADPSGIAAGIGWFGTAALTLATFGTYTGIGMAGLSLARSAGSLGLARGSMAFGGMAVAGAGIGGGVAYSLGGNIGTGAFVGAEIVTGLGAFSPRTAARIVEGAGALTSRSVRATGRFVDDALTALDQFDPLGGMLMPRAIEGGANRAVKGVGAYRDVAGHHIHAKRAFEGITEYNLYDAFAISDDALRKYGVRHADITAVQQRLFREFAASGAPNTLTHHSRIAYQALVEGGMPVNVAKNLVIQSQSRLIQSNVVAPTKIPWGGR